MPGPLPLLHVRHRARHASTSRVPVAGRGPRDRPRRAPRWAARRRCSPSATGPRTAGPRPGSGWTRTATTTPWPTSGPWRSGCWRRPGCCRTSTPGVLTWPDFQRLKPVAPSMGMMLETTADAAVHRAGRPALRQPGQGPRGPAAGAGGRRPLQRPVHHRHPDRHRRDRWPSGPTRCSRSARSAREYGGIQEVIVQNFRAKPDTAMRGMPDAELDDLAATIAVARLVLGPAARIQAPPNLVGDEYPLILAAGIDDWGGVSPLTPDHVNPERPWPQIDDLAARTAAAGFALRERLTIYPAYHRGEPWLDPRLAAHVGRAGRPGDRAGRATAPCPAACPGRSPTAAGASARGRRGRPTCTSPSTPTGRTGDRRDDFAEVYGDWDEIAGPDRRRGRAGPGARAAGPAACGRAAPGSGRRGGVGAAARRARPGRAHRRRGAGPARRRRPRAGGARRAGRRPAPGRRRRRRHLRGHPQHQLHQRLLHRLPVLRLRPAPHRRRRLHPVAEPGRRPGRRRPGRPARPRCACRAASTPTCPAPRTSTSPPRSSGACPGHPRARVLADGGRQRRLPHRHAGPRVADRGPRGRAWTRCPAPPRRSSTTRCAGC